MAKNLKPKNFPKNLKSLMAKEGVMQSEMCRKSGLSKAAMSQILAGRRSPSLKSVCKILKALPSVDFYKLVQ